MLELKFISTQADNDLKLLIAKVTDNVDQLLQQLPQGCYAKDEYANIPSDKRRREYLAVRLAIYHLLGKEMQIRYNPEGKPFLTDGSYQISISHSGQFIAVVAHPTRNVGVDIECPGNKIAKVFTRFMSNTELEDFSGGTSIQQLQIAWSAKEALYKIIGKDAVDFRNQLRIFGFEPQSEGQLEAEHVPTKTKYQLSYIQSEKYTLVYCLA